MAALPAATLGRNGDRMSFEQQHYARTSSGLKRFVARAVFGYFLAFSAKVQSRTACGPSACLGLSFNLNGMPAPL